MLEKLISEFRYYEPGFVRYYEQWTDEQGRFHNPNGPAIVFCNGDKYWYTHGELQHCDFVIARVRLIYTSGIVTSTEQL